MDKAAPPDINRIIWDYEHLFWQTDGTPALVDAGRGGGRVVIATEREERIQRQPVIRNELMLHFDAFSASDGL